MDFFSGVGGALLGTTAWAILISNNDAVDIRVPIAFSGILCTLSFFIFPPHAYSFKLNAALGTLLLVYQWCLSVAFQKGGAITQAIVNCNVVFIYIYTVASGKLPFSIMVMVLALCACITSGILVLTIHRQHILLLKETK